MNTLKSYNDNFANLTEEELGILLTTYIEVVNEYQIDSIIDETVELDKSTLSEIIYYVKNFGKSMNGYDKITHLLS